LRRSLIKLRQASEEERVERDAKRTLPNRRAGLQLLEIQLLVTIYRKRGMGWLIAPGEPIFQKPAKINK